MADSTLGDVADNRYINSNPPSVIERLRGKRTSDIDLPNTTGNVDDRVLADQENRTWNPLTKMAIRSKRLQQRAMPRRGGR